MLCPLTRQSVTSRTSSINISFVSYTQSHLHLLTWNFSQQGEGLELQQVPLQGFNSTPAIVNNISDPIFKAWVEVVNSYWTLLVR
jgi:hypothetical protein